MLSRLNQVHFPQVNAGGKVREGVGVRASSPGCLSARHLQPTRAFACGGAGHPCPHSLTDSGRPQGCLGSPPLASSLWGSWLGSGVALRRAAACWGAGSIREWGRVRLWASAARSGRLRPTGTPRGAPARRPMDSHPGLRGVPLVFFRPLVNSVRCLGCC